MILGMSVATFTLVHVAISLIGIATGLIVLVQMIGNRPLGTSNLVFLITTILTSVTGFFFHSAFGPPHALGVISLVLLVPAVIALYAFGLRSYWRIIYIVTAVMALYLNIVVAVVQSFQKIPALAAIAPTQTEAPFKIAQGIVLVIIVIAGFLAFKRFRPMAIAKA